MTIIIKTIYETVNGKQFNYKEDAEKEEALLLLHQKLDLIDPNWGSRYPSQVLPELMEHFILTSREDEDKLKQALVNLHNCLNTASEKDYKSGLESITFITNALGFK